MKIVRYYPRASKGDGGITNSVRRISEATVRAGAAVTIAVDDDAPPRGNNTFSWLSVPHAGNGIFRRPVGLGEQLRGADLLVLHSAWVYHNIYAATVAQRFGVPYVLEPRGAYDPYILNRRRLLKRAWWWAMEQKMVRNALAIHVFFESELEHLDSLGYKGPAIVAPNGVATPPGASWDGGSGGYVLWIGRFDPEHKGLDLLLHALRRILPAQRPHVLLHGPDWVGGKEKVVALTKELGLEDSVVIGDPVYGDEKWRLMSEAAAFVYPSRWEGFGNSPAEAVSLGVPTLVTPYPLGRWLSARGAAVMAEATPDSLAAGLHAVLSPSAQPISQTGIRLVREHFGWDSIARAWLEQTTALV